MFIVFFSGCASVPVRKSVSFPVHDKKRFIALEDFCRGKKFSYRFNTLDDIIRFSSESVEMKVLLASRIVYVNGRMLSVSAAPYYSGGIIYLPREISGLLNSIKTGKITPTLPLSVHTIVIDPGHGGKDPGAISRHGYKEKDINLKVARYLKRELDARGFDVYLTRQDDTFLSLKQRVEFARRNCADLFISIHANSNRSRSIKGFEVYYLSSKYNTVSPRRVVRNENKTLNIREVRTASSQDSLWDVLCVGNNVVSFDLANAITSTFSHMGFYVRSPRGAPFYVLKFAVVPSVLVEIGYLSNQHEEKLLRKSYYQKQVAEGIAVSIEKINHKYTRLAAVRQ